MKFMEFNRIAFFLKFISEPQKIGSFTPSSRFLTRKIFYNLPWDNLNTIVELGAGTGIFTRYIAMHKKDSCRIVVIEQDSVMRGRLEFEYPEMIFGSQAENLPYILQYAALPKVDCIVSGLPFACFSQDLRKCILDGIYASLKTEGRFVAFQYSLQMRSLLKQYFRTVEIGFEFFNFPPAFVYYCEK